MITGLDRELFVKFINKTKKKLRMQCLFKVGGDHWNTKELVYIQIYDNDGHLLYSEKLRFFGDKLVHTP